jgi:TPR repeat protein
MYLHGKGAERDVGKASELLKLAAQNGSTLAYTDLFDVLWESDDESAEEEKVQIVEYLASVGEPEAQRLRGRMLRHGVGVEKDLEKAIECIRVAVDANVARALPDLCDILMDTGTEDAAKEMVSTATRYAELNEPWALNRLANARMVGIGTEKDVEEGLRLHMKAMEYGSAESARDFYDYADSIKDVKALEKAIGPLRRFAEHGDPDCMMRIGRMHWEGYCAPYDRAAGLEWMRAAASLRREYRQELGSLVGEETGAEARDERRPPANVYLCNSTEGRGCAHVQEEDRSEDPRAFHRSEE